MSNYVYNLVVTEKAIADESNKHTEEISNIQGSEFDKKGPGFVSAGEDKVVEAPENYLREKDAYHNHQPAQQFHQGHDHFSYLEKGIDSYIEEEAGAGQQKLK